MKKVFQKITALFMTVVVLLSTLSFTIDMHYCGNTLVDTAVFQKAKGCGMKMDVATTSSMCSIIKKDCCKEDQILVKGQDELKISFEKLSVDQQFFVASFVYTYINLFEGIEQKAIAFKEYSPPIVIKQIFKLDETYLI
jgi:hypothetical protein